jgi:DNA-binding transcriptional ArsR family regulator
VTYELALNALADPTRLELFESVREKERTVGELANVLLVSQPAVSQHLRVLRRAKLITERREGTRRYVRASPQGLVALRRWLDAGWDEALEAFALRAKKGRS